MIILLPLRNNGCDVLLMIHPEKAPPYQNPVVLDVSLRMFQKTLKVHLRDKSFCLYVYKHSLFCNIVKRSETY